MLEWLKTIFLKQCPPCIVCEENEGELQLSETNWICEKCASGFLERHARRMVAGE